MSAAVKAAAVVPTTRPAGPNYSDPPVSQRAGIAEEALQWARSDRPDPIAAGGSTPPPAPISPLVIAQLVSLFEMHNGFVDGREFEAEGFRILDLVRDGLINPPRSIYDLNKYTVGETLRRAVQG